MKIKSFRLASLAGALVLAGCSSITPMEMPADSPSTATAAREAMSISEGWDTPDVVTEGSSSIVLLTPFDLPAEVKSRKLQLTLEPGATVMDVVAILGEMGVPIIISDQEAAAKSFYLPKFNGTLGSLLNAVTRATDVWFTWKDGSILASSEVKIAVTVPQDSKFSESLAEGLGKLGVSSHSVVWEAGMAVIEVAPSQFLKVRQYLSRMTNNSAFITLQVAVVNVTLNQNVKQGIDWEKLQVSAVNAQGDRQFENWRVGGNKPNISNNRPNNNNNNNNNEGGILGVGNDDGGLLEGGFSGNNNSNSNNNSGGSSVGAGVGEFLGTAVQAFASGSGLEALVIGKRFSFAGMFNYLQTYGDAETKQNVILKTIGGNPVEFKSLTQIPYVKEIGVTSSSSFNSNSNLGSSKTEKADDGIEVKLTPTYDAAANTVTVDLSLSIKAVVAFNELSAGNQLGTLTQPTTAERSFTDILRMRPGQTVVVGGLTYDSISNNNGSPLFLQGTSLESQSLKLDRQSMFIVVRSSVVRIGQLKEEGMVDDNYLELSNPDDSILSVKGTM